MEHANEVFPIRKDRSNPCGNMFLAVAGFKDNLRTSPPQNATLVQSFINLCRFGALSADKSAQKCNFGSKLVKVRGYSLFCDEWFSLQTFVESRKE